MRLEAPEASSANPSNGMLDEEWWPDQPWRMEGFRADPALKDGFLELHEALGEILRTARERGDTEVTVELQFLSMMYYALLTQIQMSNQTVLLEIQDLKTELLKLKDH